jgi:DNA-binding MarR family transcriptional regulator
VDVEGAPNRLRTLPSWLLGQLSARAREVTAQVLGVHGLHRSQYALLAALAEFGPQSQAALAERSGLDRSDVVTWIDELAERRLLSRQRDPADRRRNLISLSPDGRRLVGRLDKELAGAQDRLLAALPERDRRQLVALLSRALIG